MAVSTVYSCPNCGNDLEDNGIKASLWCNHCVMEIPDLWIEE